MVQHCDASLATEAKKSTKVKVDNYFLQVLIGLRKIQQYFKMVHNDLFLYSIVIQRIKANSKWYGQSVSEAKFWSYPYKNGKKRFYLYANRSLVKISDLGFACSFIKPGGVMRNDIFKGELNDIGMYNTYEPQCDIMNILMDLYQNYQCQAGMKCLDFIADHYKYKNVKDMLEDVLLPGQHYRIKKDKLKGLTAEFLLDHTPEFCTPNVILYERPYLGPILRME